MQTRNLRADPREQPAPSCLGFVLHKTKTAPGIYLRTENVSEPFSEMEALIGGGGRGARGVTPVYGPGAQGGVTADRPLCGACAWRPARPARRKVGLMDGPGLGEK